MEKEFFVLTVGWYDMNKYTIQVCLGMKDLDFLTNQATKHGLKNNSEVIRTIISRYKGMEDYIIEHKKALSEIADIKKSKVIL